MKKLITSTIIVLPLIILAIMLVSGALLSITTHIYVEAIELEKDDVIRLRMEDELNPPTYNLAEEVTILPLKATNRGLSYKTDDETIAKVDNNGIITAVFYGETFITVTSNENKAATAKRKVVITDTAVHAVRLNKDYETDIYEGQTHQMSATILPAEAGNQGVIWSSSNPKILDVSPSGMITARGAGKAEVIATSQEKGTIFDKLEITCHKKLLDITYSGNFQTSATHTQFPNITPLPKDDDNPENTIDPADVSYSYSSSNDEIATVTKTGAITFLQPGRVTITVSATDFNGTEVTKKQDFVSTMGYYKDSIFNSEQFLWSECHAGEQVPANWFAPQYDGTYLGFKSIECLADGINLIADMITYDSDTKTFVFGDDIECESFIQVTLTSTIYNSSLDILEVDKTETFRINKNAIESGVNAKLTLNGSELKNDKNGETNNITIHDIGDSIDLIISDASAMPKISGDCVSVTISEDGKKVTLTAKDVCTNQELILAVGVSRFKITLNIEAKANQLAVNVGDFALQDGQTYNTLLNELTFTVVPSRTDKKTITNSTISYSYDKDSWLSSTNGIINADTSRGEINFKCGNAEFKINLQTITLKDFGIRISASMSRVGGSVELYEIESVKNVETVQSFDVPSDIQDSVTLEIVPNVTILGGFGNDDNFFKSLFEINFVDTSWQAGYSASNSQITISFGGARAFDNKITVLYDDLSIDLRFVRIKLTSIDFNGFENNLHAGYQQANVFAKHSYYQSKVEYFKVPFQAYEEADTLATSDTIDTIKWQLSRYVGNSVDEQITTQIGKKVIYKGTEYTLTQDGETYVLKDKAGNNIAGKDGQNAQGITFVDIYSEPGYARVYFGNIAGLKEIDVQNDYFGNFDDNPTWSQPSDVEPDGSDRSFAHSENAFSFLRVEAGDGANNGINCHYNFNVLDDLGGGEGNKIYNIFNANGYYQFSNIVLHTSLYGPGELDGDDPKIQQKKQEAEENDLFLDYKVNESTYETTKLNKTTIFGNGNRINVMARHIELKKSTPANELGWSGGVTLTNIYNLKFYGANPNEKIVPTNQSVVLVLKNAYYCDLQYYAKINVSGGTGYFKNTVLHGASRGAVQLYGNDIKVYMENVVFSECVSAIMSEQFAAANQACYFKGFYDILNYYNGVQLKELVPDMAKMYIDYFLTSDPATDQYAEWMGKTFNGYDIHTHKFVNPIFLDTTLNNKALNIPYTWDEKTKSYVRDVDINMPITLEGMFYGWTYNSPVTTDGGQKEGGKYSTRDMSQLFSNDRYIRLLCQYKNFEETDNLVKNESHILWHMQRVYRDTSLIEDREPDHIKDLINSLKGTTWQDGTGVNSDGQITENGKVIESSIVDVNKMISCAIEPRKEQV